MIQDKNTEALWRAEKKHRQMVALITIPLLLGVLVLIWSISQTEDFFYRKSLLPKEIYLTVGIILVGLSGLSALMTYLQTGFKKNTQYDSELQSIILRNNIAESFYPEEISKFLSEIREDISKLKSDLEKIKNLNEDLDSDERKSIASMILNQMTSEASQNLLNDLRSSIAEKYDREAKDKDLAKRFDESRMRLSKELEALGWRGNLNLSLGAITTVIGLVLLGMSVFSEVTSSKDIWAFASHFLPRLTLVLMIELFAYFFLSLYKASLSEIKYFQNELTNIEAKQVSLCAAVAQGDTSVISDILSKIAMTERNNIISKDQTTVEIETARMEKDNKNETLKYITEFFQKKS